MTRLFFKKMGSAWMMILFTGILVSFYPKQKNPLPRVWLIPSLHGMHLQNSRFTYDSLKSVIQKIQPDIIAVELRPEDIAEDSLYLAKNYPYEMRMMHTWFPGVQVVGFDWLGADIAGKKIPEGYWKNLAPIKKWEKELDADSAATRASAVCDAIVRERLALLKTLSLRDLLNSTDAELTDKYYACLDQQLKGTPHVRVLAFYETRNKKILENITRMIREHPGKKIVIVTGDDHRVFLEKRLLLEKIFD